GVEGAAGAVASTQVAPAVMDALHNSGLPQDVQTAIAALAAAGAGGVIGGAQGAGAAYNEAENNYQGFVRFAAQICSRTPACAALAVGEGAKTPIGGLVAATLLIDAWNKENNRTETPANPNQLPGIPGYPADTDTQTANTEYPADYDIDRPGRYETPAVEGQTDQTSAGGYQPTGTDLIGGAVYSEGKNNVPIDTVLTSAQAPYKGSTVIGHALSKHAGRNPAIWGSTTGAMSTWNDQAIKHLDDIVNAPGEFERITNDRGVSFLEKRLPDGRGARLNLDGTFKGFID
uniref:hypothetical protein n=1 Tax=Halomonas sp. TaxID=1486246 RepID=UPI002625574E